MNVNKEHDMITISVIVGSTRQGRFSEKPAQWILQHLQKRAGIEARLLDLRGFPMPFVDQASRLPGPAARHMRMRSSNCGPP
jgi:NAD(P)H-dependent FMN reductase